MNITQTAQIIRRQRLLMGQALIQLREIYDLRQTESHQEQLKSLSKDFSRRLGVTAGMVFTLREALPPDQFQTFVDQLQIGATEMEDLMKVATS